MTYYPGRYFQICDICGLRKYNTETRKNWKNQIVCADTCWEPKHPQLEIKAIRDNQAVPNPRPEGTDVELSPGDVTADDL